MIKLIPFIILIMTLNSFATDFNIKNAKIGSTIISNWNAVGHAAVVVKEYVNEDDEFFIIGSHSGGVRYDSYKNI